jgi:hypothetical protein
MRSVGQTSSRTRRVIAEPRLGAARISPMERSRLACGPNGNVPRNGVARPWVPRSTASSTRTVTVRSKRSTSCAESYGFRHREGHMHGLRLAPVEGDAGEPDQPLVREHDRGAARIRVRPPSGRNLRPLDNDFDPETLGG